MTKISFDLDFTKDSETLLKEIQDRARSEVEKRESKALANAYLATLHETANQKIGTSYKNVSELIRALAEHASPVIRERIAGTAPSGRRKTVSMSKDTFRKIKDALSQPSPNKAAIARETGVSVVQVRKVAKGGFDDKFGGDLDSSSSPEPEPIEDNEESQSPVIEETVEESPEVDSGQSLPVSNEPEALPEPEPIMEELPLPESLPEPEGPEEIPLPAEDTSSLPPPADFRDAEQEGAEQPEDTPNTPSQPTSLPSDESFANLPPPVPSPPNPDGDLTSQEEEQPPFDSIPEEETAPPGETDALPPPAPPPSADAEQSPVPPSPLPPGDFSNKPPSLKFGDGKKKPSLRLSKRKGSDGLPKGKFSQSITRPPLPPSSTIDD